MDIAKHLEEYVQRRSFLYLPGKPKRSTVKNLLISGPFALMKQEGWNDSECLAFNIESVVRENERNKGTAIVVYQDFLKFLGTKGIEVKVEFPAVDPSNSFERLMFMAKYLQDPKNFRI